ncbi:hypothetical protein PV10_07031 [Exophiala mesophila]|uniref:Rhodanese domain-containing protein n=1 Tax=Exophiala mesophila TaxID=212818 RepID=A0A0D1Z6X0_EXOME|nr:uncharacterized protein PV10_07031 [Exophiala mesophila]KIV89644.1 hypothetical protein PV10_07031 [Exophiala mesophila]
MKFRLWSQPSRTILTNNIPHPRHHGQTPFPHPRLRSMSSSSSFVPITISSLTYLHPTSLAKVLLEPGEREKVAIIDVRDSDHIGGNINGSTWVPLNQLDARIPELVRTLKDKDKVVFHCMLSQQRGPTAALRYARAKQRADDKDTRSTQTSSQVAAQTPEEGESNKSHVQEVCVLEGGFESWQSRYGEDSRLTVDYQPDLWD